MMIESTNSATASVPVRSISRGTSRCLTGTSEGVLVEAASVGSALSHGEGRGSLVRPGGSPGSAAGGEESGVAVQVERPALVGRDAVSDRFPARAVPVEVAVLELDARALRRLGDEPDLDLAGVVGVGDELPVRADVPAEDDALVGLVGQDPRPPALAAVLADVVDVAADA